MNNKILEGPSERSTRCSVPATPFKTKFVTFFSEGKGAIWRSEDVREPFFFQCSRSQPGDRAPCCNGTAFLLECARAKEGWLSWFKALDSKSNVGLNPPWVRIPPLPPVFSEAPPYVAATSICSHCFDCLCPDFARFDRPAFFSKRWANSRGKSRCHARQNRSCTNGRSAGSEARDLGGKSAYDKTVPLWRWS